MRLYFAKAELLLQKRPEGDFILELAGKRLGTFKQEKKAVAAYNKIRQDFEKHFPPTEMTSHERRKLLEQHLADDLVGHNSWLEPQKKPAKTRVHHS